MLVADSISSPEAVSHDFTCLWLHRQLGEQGDALGQWLECLTRRSRVEGRGDSDYPNKREAHSPVLYMFVTAGFAYRPHCRINYVFLNYVRDPIKSF